MKHLNKLILIFIMGLAFTFLVNEKSFSQVASAVHDLGKISENQLVHGDWFAYKTFYPNGSYKNRFNNYQYPVVFYKEFVSTAGSAPGVGLNAYWFRYGGGKFENELYAYKRSTPPEIFCDGINLAPPYQGEVDPDMDADSKWYWKIHFFQKIAGFLEITSRAWVNQNHDDYIIYNEKNTISLDVDGDGVDDAPDQSIDVMRTKVHLLSPNQRAFAAYHTEGGYRCMGWRETKWFPQTLSPSAPRQNIAISMIYEADRVRIHKPYGWSAPGAGGELDDAGLPMGPETGALTIDNCEIIANQHTGFGLLYAPTSVTDATDATNMPIGSGKLKAWSWFGNALPDVWTWLNVNWDVREDEMGYEDPDLFSSSADLQVQAWGPWTMTNNQSIEIVTYKAIGSTGEDLAREKGLEFMKWYRDGVGDFDNAAKNAFLAQSLDSLLMMTDRAYWNYSQKHYDIADPLGAPNIYAVSGPDKNTISWSYNSADDFKDPDSGTDDFKEWRLYRKLGHKEVNHDSDNGYRKYELVGTFPQGTTEYEDTGVIRGNSYHYCITALDDGSQNNGLFPGMSLESSFYVNRTPAAQRPFKPGESTSDNVLIVPNPYSVSTGSDNAMNFTGRTNDILFVNIPAYCTLKIYTSTGDLIQTLEHTSGSGDEVWANMRTASNQYPAAGVYILVVDNARDTDNIPIATKMFKFVIVR